MPFKPFTKGQNSHTHAGGLRTSTSHKGSPHPTPAGPGGKFDPNDSPGMDENGDGIYGKPVKRANLPQKAALEGLKSIKIK